MGLSVIIGEGKQDSNYAVCIEGNLRAPAGAKMVAFLLSKRRL